MNYKEAIELRISTRAYSDTLPDSNTLKRLRELITEPIHTPNKTSPNFSIVDLSDLDTSEFKKYGTYGSIKNAKFFIVGSCKATKEALIDFGYALEHIVLNMTKMGLSTCWLGGNFNKALFENATSFKDQGVIPSILAFGYHLNPRTTGSKRKSAVELITIDQVPLSDNQTTAYDHAFKSFILSPSAMNGQPWRLNYDTVTGNIDFFMKPSLLFTALSHTIRKGINMNYIDLGIAMYHFESVLHEDHIPGQWFKKRPTPTVKSLEYIMTWKRMP